MNELIHTQVETIRDTISRFCVHYPGEVIFTTSFGLEDQVLTDIICRNNIKVEIITLDTGRLFEETYKTMSKTLEHYSTTIKSFHPNSEKLSEMISKKGPFSFYKCIDDRKECCRVRKVEPLTSALSGKKIWITGLRSSQSASRNELKPVLFDPVFQITKYNPLIYWDNEMIKTYIDLFHVPYNVMHDHGFPSIGCAPCTRSIKEGDDLRSGRWWWEMNTKKECGLHT